MAQQTMAQSLSATGKSELLREMKKWSLDGFSNKQSLTDLDAADAELSGNQQLGGPFEGIEYELG